MRSAGQDDPEDTALSFRAVDLDAPDSVTEFADLDITGTLAR
jgi:hypothetical protein